LNAAEQRPPASRGLDEFESVYQCAQSWRAVATRFLHLR